MFLHQCDEFMKASPSDRPATVRMITRKMLRSTERVIQRRIDGILKSFLVEEHGFNLDAVIITMMFFVSGGADLSFLIMEEKFLRTT